VILLQSCLDGSTWRDMAVISAAYMLECGLTASVCHAPTWRLPAVGRPFSRMVLISSFIAEIVFRNYLSVAGLKSV
jgi:hypothetical protein